MGFNVIEAAQRVGINGKTLRRWEDDFRIDVPKNNRGYREYSDELIKIFERIKGYKDSNHGENTIIRKLELQNILFKPEEIKNTEINTQISEPPNTMQNEIRDLQKNLMEQMDEKLDSIMELSEKYSRASYEVGSLRSELRSAYEKIELLKDQYDEKIFLITDGSTRSISSMKRDLERVEVEKLKILEENEKLKAGLEKEKNKGFFEKFLGK